MQLGKEVSQNPEKIKLPDVLVEKHVQNPTTSLALMVCFS